MESVAVETRKRIKTEIAEVQDKAASSDQQANKFDEQMADVFVKERDLNNQGADIRRNFVDYMGTRSPSVHEMGKVRSRPDQPVSAAMLRTLTSVLDGEQMVQGARFEPQVQVMPALLTSVL